MKTGEEKPTIWRKISTYIAISLLGAAIITLLIKSFFVGLALFFIVGFIGYVISQSEKGAFLSK